MFNKLIAPAGVRQVTPERSCAIARTSAGSSSFLKKTKKHFLSTVRRVVPPALTHRQKFFGSFFQKRTASLWPQ
jgi:hypothetical protein